MARYSLSKGAATGAGWAPIGFKLGGPKGAGVAFAAGTVLGGFSGVDDQLDTSGYLKGLQRYEKKTLSQTRRAANEVGARTGSNLAARGINDSKMAAYINQSNRGKMYGQTLDHLADTRAQMEVQLAHAQQMLKRARTTDERDAWARTTKHLYDWMMHEYLGDMGKGWESPEGAPVTPDDLPMTSVAQPPGMPERQRPGSTMPESMRPVAPGIADTGLPQIPAGGVPTPEAAPAAPNAPDMSPLEMPDELNREGEIGIGPIIGPKESMGPENGVFTRDARGNVPTESDMIGRDLEGDPMYEGWEKEKVHKSENGTRYPEYIPKSHKDELPDTLPLSHSPQEQEIEKKLGSEVASYLKQMLPNYAEIFEWT